MAINCLLPKSAMLSKMVESRGTEFGRSVRDYIPVNESYELLAKKNDDHRQYA